jgi:hypothetical protein
MTTLKVPCRWSVPSVTSGLTRRRRAVLRVAATTVVAVSALSTTGAARADSWGVQVGGGFADHGVKKAQLGGVWDPGLSWWEIGAYHFTAVAEADVAWWHTDQGNVNSNVFEVGITPVLRFIRSSGAIRPYIEVGAGVRYISHPRISDTFTLSTAFQFATMAGVGAQFGGRQQYQAGVRFQHLSNAGIKEPNPGINFTQFYLQYNF